MEVTPCKFGTGGRYRGFRRGPNAGKAEHVVIAERALGRPLPKGAEVHHVDEDPANNLPSNLVICQDHAYHMLIHYRTRVRRAGGNPDTDGVCRSCGRAKPRQLFHRRSNRPSGYQSKCKACYRQLFQESK